MAAHYRAYVDASVFGGAFDEEFQRPSETFFRQVRQGRFVLVISALVRDELREAPQAVRGLFEETVPVAEVVPITQPAFALQAAYLDAGVVTRRSPEDVLHVALASVSGCALIVSWNFRHIVHFEKIERYNAVNVLKGCLPGRDFFAPGGGPK